MRVDSSATAILRQAAAGDHRATDRLLPIIYEELRRLASAQLRRERPNHTLQPTELVHEAYLRLIDQDRSDWANRAHFLALAAEMIRRVLVDHARKRAALKRGGAHERIGLELAEAKSERGLDLLELDSLLDELNTLSERQRRVVELRFFGGLSVEETAHLLGVSAPTVKNEWRLARAWLGRRLRD
jgi:RNA polymerase sigma-70 factor (ECF subfamily)